MSDVMWAWTAFAAAVAGTLASVGLSLALKLRACPLCFYQRSAVMGVACVLLVGLLAAPGSASLLCLVSWPLHVTGLGVALFHVRLVEHGALECPRGFLGLGPAPHQSLLYFLMAGVPLVIGARESWDFAGLGTTAGVAAATGLGLLMAGLCVLSAPPLPPVPTQPYDAASQPLDICRPPFRGAAHG